MGSPRPASAARAPGFSARAVSRWPGLPGPSAGGPPTSWPPLCSFRRHVHTRAGSARITPLWLSCSPNRTHLPGFEARNRIHGSWFTGGPNQSIEVGQFRVSNSHVILLNKKRIEGTKGQRWGFYEVSQEWPDKKMLKKSEQAHNLGMFCYRCKVSNHGPTNVIYLGIRIDLWFGNQGGEQNKITYAPVISAIDSGRDAEFYLVNACNVLVSAIWQTTARAQLLGEAKQRDISLMRAYRSPVDQIMMFFPATVNWSGEVCE